MIPLVLTILIVVVVIGAALAVVRALLALGGAKAEPYTNLIYALVVLLLVLLGAQYVMGGGHLWRP